MTIVRIVRIFAVVAAIAGAQAPSFGFAQQSGLDTSSDANRDCQTVRKCNYTRNGSFRGCISAYTCRTCRMVAARCSIPGAASNRVCREMRCSWGA